MSLGSLFVTYGYDIGMAQFLQKFDLTQSSHIQAVFHFAGLDLLDGD